VSAKRSKPSDAAEYDQAASYVQLLAERLRAVRAESERTATIAQKAIDVNAKQHAIEAEHVLCYRELCTALADSAGHDRPRSLPECIAAAEALLSET
jgi:hypothetical protein